MDRIIAVGSDHAAFKMKETVKKYLQSFGYEVKDYGTFSEEPVDYPDIIHPLAKDVNDGKIKKAVILCGSGIGVSITANKYPYVRCALCCSPELAKLSRQHNDANILAMSGRFISEKEALQMVDNFLNTEFERGRHQKRIEKIPIKS
ncbi:MAG: ribose 5-phosphate isomerase B [Bacteroidales bacterium]|jgi:ribose 5-phosphate isomerase B|nr:ribose 5-phosphate isomerase B [Bacteroidales bacterium]